MHLLYTFLLTGCGDKPQEKHVPPQKQEEVVEPSVKKEEKKADEVPPIPVKKVEEIEGSKESKDEIKEESEKK
jgi:hypothetical protein